MNPLYDKRAKFLGNYAPDVIAKAPVQTIPIANILSVQKTVMRDHVHNYAFDPKNTLRSSMMYDGSSGPLPIVKPSSVPGKYDLGDGNHRVAAALLSGKTEIQVRVLPKSARRLPDTDW